MATFLTSAPTSAPQGPYVIGSTNRDMMLGSKFYDQASNAYRYCLVGATALVPGKLYQAPAEITNHQNLTPAAAAIGATQVTVTLGATAATANQYSEGYLVVTVTPGQGYKYRISGNAAAALSTTCVITLEDPIQVALTTSSRVDLVLSPYSGVILNPTTATSCVVGAAVYPVAAASYGWVQSGGIAPLLIDDQTVVVGTNVSASNQAAGAIEPATGVQATVGVAVTGGATTEYVAVRLNIDA
jgi:hypothetical protein